MTEREQQKLKSAYETVFDTKGNIKNCGRNACSNFISLMKQYTSKNIGDVWTGKLEIDTIKLEYYRVIATGPSNIKSCLDILSTIFCK